MTQDEVLEMAAEIWNAGSSFPIPSSDDILRFAAFVAAKYEQKIQDLEDLITELQERQA